MATCNFFPKEYIDELRYVSTNLLGIINTQILIGSDLGDGIVTCNAPNNQPATVFDCDRWVIIKDLLISSSDEPDNTGFLLTLERTLNCIIGDVTAVPMSLGLRAQFERFRCLVQAIESRIDSIHCISTCEEVIGDLLCLLIKLLTQLISAVSKAATLVYYAQCANSTITGTNGNTSVLVFFECIACDFINDLCELENLLKELNDIIIAFVACDMQNCTPSGTAASCTPQKHRHMYPYNMIYKSNYGRGQNSCGCGYNKE